MVFPLTVLVCPSCTGDFGDENRESREVIDAEQRPAGGYHQEGVGGTEAGPCRRQSLCPSGVDLEVDVLAVLAAATVDDLEDPAMQRVERVGHPSMMRLTLAIVCITRWFRMAPPT